MVHHLPSGEALCLYVSQLAPGFGFADVEQVLRASRECNPLRHIRGALVFDGARFCQLIVGPEPAVGALMVRIEGDPRHTHLRHLPVNSADPRPCIERWVGGYCGTLELDRIVAESARAGGAALGAFLALLGNAFVE